MWLHCCWEAAALADSACKDVMQGNAEMAAELSRVMEEREAVMRRLAAHEAADAAQARCESRSQSVPFSSLSSHSSENISTAPAATTRGRGRFRSPFGCDPSQAAQTVRWMG